MRAIEVTDTGTGAKALIAIHHIVAIAPDGESTCVTVIGEGEIFVQESYDELRQYFRKAPKFTNHV